MLKVALAGATGLVGGKIVEVLIERKIPIDEMHFLASARSAGTEMEFGDKKIVVEDLSTFDFSKVDLVLFAAGGDRSEEFIPKAIEKGAICVDNSSVFRMDPKVPLVVPEVNPEDVEWHNGVIANPNCSTIQCMAALKCVENLAKIKRVVYSTYQSVSGSGLKGLRDLDEGLSENYPYPITNNILPHIDSFLDNGYTKEEIKMIEETKKILHRPDMKVTATTVRVPVRFAHSVSINVETETEITPDEYRAEVKKMPGLILKDDVSKLEYPMALYAEGKDEIFIGRIRSDESVEHGLNMWTVADNIRKGAATNAVQIVELLLEKGILKP